MLPFLQYLQINYCNGSSSRENKTDFISLSDPTQNSSLDRIYDNNSNDTKQHLSFGLGSFSGWILPPKLRNISVTLQNNITINTHSQNNSVQDRDTATGAYVANHYLSGSSNYVTINELPALNLGKNYFKVLANRYQKNLSINLNAQGQFIIRKMIPITFFKIAHRIIGNLYLTQILIILIGSTVYLKIIII